MNKKTAGILLVVLLFFTAFISRSSNNIRAPIDSGNKNISIKTQASRDGTSSNTRAKEAGPEEKTSIHIESQQTEPEPKDISKNSSVNEGISSKPVPVPRTEAHDNAASREQAKKTVINASAAQEPIVSPEPVKQLSVSRGENSRDKGEYPLLSKNNGIYGQFHYRDSSGGRIEIDPAWINENIVSITLPGLNRSVQVHKEAADNFIQAFNYINNGTAVINGKEVPLLSLINSMNGTWVTRHVNWDPARGLSNHSWGTAIDINARDHFRYVNPGQEPNDPNLILWEKAFKPAGFSWGNSYSDSMHFELLK